MAEIWLQVTAGRGPAECQWVVTRLAVEIAKAARAQGLSCEELELIAGEQGGTLRSALLSISGAGAAAFVRDWQGTVQWIGPSPYRPGHRRMNWFVGVDLVTPPAEAEIAAAQITCEVMRAMTSRRRRLLPIPGGPVTLTRTGEPSLFERSKALITCASSASRPMNGAPPLRSPRMPRMASPTTAEPSSRERNS